MRLAVAVLMVPAMAGAQEVVTTTPIAETGAGLGARITILTLNSTGGSATGCISPAGKELADCGYVNNVVQEQSFVIPISALGSGTGTLGTDLRIIANFNEPGNAQDATIQNFELVLYNAAGAAYATDFDFVGPITFNPAGTGTGGEGFAFKLTDAAAAIFNTAVAAGYTNIGFGASLTNVTGGNDTFSLQRVNSTTSVVPEPSTYALMAAGLAGIFVARRRRNRA
jgi:hypothetical protein